MKYITSAKNNFVKNAKKLHKKKYRSESNLYLIEGEHLVEEAVKHNADIVYVIVEENMLEKYNYLIQDFDDEKVYLVTDSIIQTLSTLPTPQGIMAIIEKKAAVDILYQGRILILDCVQDPGNVGTMIRTADAAGFTHIILGEGCADVYQPKVLRAMQGSQYHLTLEEGDVSERMSELFKREYLIYGTELNPEAIDYREIKKDYQNLAIVMGNEGQGVSAEILKYTTKNVYIPIIGQAESLNVAVAAGILMFSLQ
ncbi:TrmH family RNA methyltransferase [Vagococcus vulneris]|uniref:23S rRNA methyltransferase n=1 Tax=Vagococcus vulneris TaxID=1977869 RepID=A0A429ZZ81_9ENTE|nr:RNA methyltransferase [Vagococcus vulneris]RST99304.1 23S rRNA methyltransferase [Vagococcus vulneris]